MHRFYDLTSVESMASIDSKLLDAISHIVLSR